MATSQSKTPAGIFQENYGEICPLIGKRKNFSNVTNNLFAKKLITKEELNQIETQPNLNDEERGRKVAVLLLDKIDEDEGQAAQCLLDICDVFESKRVNNEPLRKIGASMKEKLSTKANQTSGRQGKKIDKDNGHDETDSGSQGSEAKPTATHTLETYQVNEVNEGDNYLLTYCKAKHLKKWHFALTVSATCIIIALVGVAINHFIVEKKDNSTTITSQVPTTISSAPPEPTITQTNPNELNVGDVKKVLKALKKAMFGPANWRDLGLSLGLIVTTLDTIGKTNGDANDYLEKTIQKWLKKEDQVKETTWQILKEAVKSTGDKAAAERIPLH